MLKQFIKLDKAIQSKGKLVYHKERNPIDAIGIGEEVSQADFDIYDFGNNVSIVRDSFKSSERMMPSRFRPPGYFPEQKNKNRLRYYIMENNKLVTDENRIKEIISNVTGIKLTKTKTEEEPKETSILGHIHTFYPNEYFCIVNEVKFENDYHKPNEGYGTVEHGPFEKKRLKVRDSDYQDWGEEKSLIESVKTINNIKKLFGVPIKKLSPQLAEIKEKAEELSRKTGKHHQFRIF